MLIKYALKTIIFLDITCSLTARHQCFRKKPAASTSSALKLVPKGGTKLHGLFY
jgi:hypothetical protein